MNHQTRERDEKERQTLVGFLPLLLETAICEMGGQDSPDLVVPNGVEGRLHPQVAPCRALPVFVPEEMQSTGR